MKWFSFVLACGLHMGAAEPTQAVVIYSQTTPSDPNAAFSSQDLSSGPILADNFAIGGTEPVTIRSLRLFGGIQGGRNDKYEDAFRIVFMEDAMGLPGDIVSGGDLDADLRVFRSLGAGPLLNGVDQPYLYAIDLGAGLELSPFNEYWMAIMNAPAPSSGWAWARASGNLDNSIAVARSDFTSRTWELVASGGMWFQLSQQNVPEPGAILLVVAGFFVCELSRYRIRQK